jgi:hypothetical protein
MDVHVPADARELVEYPSNIACFRLGERVRPVIRFIDLSSEARLVALLPLGEKAGEICCAIDNVTD